MREQSLFRASGIVRSHRGARRAAAGTLLAAALIAPTYPSPAHAAEAGAERGAVEGASAILRTGFAGVIARVRPAVLVVRVNGPKNADARRVGSAEGARDMVVTEVGSGFFVSPDGYAVTNNHVIEHARSVEVATDDGKTYRADVVGADPKTDLALIKVDGDRPFSFVKFAEHAPHVGDWVLAVGNPYGLGNTVTAGIVSARGRAIGWSPCNDLIQIDAPINRGNSGGPAFNINGNVIGVNTAILSPSGGSIGIGFAIPASMTRTIVATLKDKGFIDRGWLGVDVQAVTPALAENLGMRQAEGALVTRSRPEGPARKAGVRAGDVITAVDGRPVKRSRDLGQEVAVLPPGRSVEIELWRAGARKSVRVTLAEMPGSRGPIARKAAHTRLVRVPRIGLKLVPAADVAGAGSRGVAVTRVDSEGAAADHNLQVGDVILDVGGNPVNSPAELRRALNAAKAAGRSTVLIRVKAGKGRHFVVMPVDQG